MGPDEPGGLGDIAGAEAIHPIGVVGVELAGVDGGPGRRVDDDVRLDPAVRGQHGVAIGDVEDGLLRGDDVQSRPAEALVGPAVQLAQDLGAYLTGHPGHEHAHFPALPQEGGAAAGPLAQDDSTTGERPMSGSHEARLSQYH